MKIFKTAIIGGGAAGLLTAVELLSGKKAFSGEDVLIVERNDRVGKKLIATGNGQGNLTNSNLSNHNYYGEKDFIDAFLVCAKEIDLENYFYRLGIPLCTAKDGKKYPLSKQATSVLDVIRAYLSQKNCQTITESEVTAINKQKDYFTIVSKKGNFFAKSVVLATGGKAAKQFGTDGSAYKLATDFGHTITQLYPSLVQLKTELEGIRGLKGLKETVKVTACDNNDVLKSAVGEILFTEYGVSGNAIFQVSAVLTSVKNPIVSVEFLPDFSYEQTLNLIKDRLDLPYIKSDELLVGIINKRIGQVILKQVKNGTAEEITNALKNFKLKVTGNLGFNYAQVTKGGVPTCQIDGKTMQSKKVDNFYIVGEALDVDGDCGGYNLTFAFVSGITCAKAIKSKF